MSAQAELDTRTREFRALVKRHGAHPRDAIRTLAGIAWGSHNATLAEVARRAHVRRTDLTLCLGGVRRYKSVRRAVEATLRLWPYTLDEVLP